MKIFLKPSKGLKVPRPEDGRFLEEGGEWVEQSSYWKRRVKDGDVSEVKDAPKPQEDAQPAPVSKPGAKKGAQ